MLCVGADLIHAGDVCSGIYGSSMTSLIVTSVASSVMSLSSVKQSVNMYACMALRLFAAPCVYRKAKQSGQQGM